MEFLTINGLPVYNAIINDEDCGIMGISLVDKPAVKSNFLAFDEENKILKFKIENEEQRIVTGVIMRCNFPIFRKDVGFGDFYVMYDAQTIESMAMKLFDDGTFNNFNLNHTEGTEQGGIFLLEAYIKNEERGISPKGFENVENGSLFGSFKVFNDDVWNEIKNGTYKGFSLEGYFNLAPAVKPEPVIKSMEELLNYFK